MIPGNLFTIPMWSIPTLNFSEKKKQLEKLVKGFPEKKHGMQTFDQALYELYKKGEISYENALMYADSKNEVRLMIKLGSEASSDFSNESIHLIDTD